MPLTAPPAAHHWTGSTTCRVPHRQRVLDMLVQLCATGQKAEALQPGMWGVRHPTQACFAVCRLRPASTSVCYHRWARQLVRTWGMPAFLSPGTGSAPSRQPPAAHCTPAVTTALLPYQHGLPAVNTVRRRLPRRPGMWAIAGQAAPRGHPQCRKQC